MKIAVLGLGRMGTAIAQRLAQGEHELTVWNRSKGKAEELVRNGATEADSPEEAACAAEVVVTSLANDEAVREIALGDRGLRSYIGGRAYVDMSTISPRLSEELGRTFEIFLALPVLGAPQAVTAGEATYLAGGPEATVGLLSPLLGSLGGHLKRYPRPGQAATAKLAVNLMLLAGVATLAESMAVGREGQLSDDELTDLLCGSPMLAPGLKNRFEAVLKGSGAAWWTTELGAKDAALAVQAAGRSAAKLRVAPAVRDLYQAAADLGFDNEDIAAVSRLYR
jgi:3-hydroxyisobutyrate dehydrogenase-like beta-hydroxyacid dehydrogenase